ncbi:major facilitator superfamily MFS_1 [Dethiosulfovibrio peptidovorans DSM 11002]|uniref:Major facilitator superfamily MFS_1 n=1 Tax=Dethiosulfovibrio peptidovorans DSM 11002 TaxID=469381 RepID=D2Z665_9BACT|nr:MFS transporter [Dethiosulfovibrio peptidovorans]EFC90962.1 major facilitator superfamily MFS_1 [Dethiosulfovibrio peptidovorans DSM 11002]
MTTAGKALSSKTKVALLSTGHLVNDVHTAFLDTFLPYLVKNLGLSYAQAGILTSLSGVIHTVFQPIMGHVADRHTRPWPIMFGPIAAALGASMIPLSTSYAMALTMVTLWGIGAATFHPQGQGSLGYVAPPSELAFAISLFGLGGMSGGTISSIYAIALYRYFPHWAMPVIAVIPPLILAAVYYKTMPKIRDRSPEEDSDDIGMIKNLSSVFKRIYPIWAVTILRECSQKGVRFLLPLLIVSEGGSITKVGTFLFFLSLTASILPLIAARIAMEVGNVKIVKIIIPLASTFLVIGWATEGFLSLAMIVIGGASITACNPATDAMAQELAPDKRSTASSLMMGFSFGLAGVAMAPLGWFTDAAGLRAALGIVAFLPFLSLPVMYLLWPKKGLIR